LLSVIRASDIFIFYITIYIQTQYINFEIANL